MPTAGVDLPRALGGRREEATTPSLSCSQAACAPGLGPAEGAGPVGQLMKAQSRSGFGGIRRGTPHGLGGMSAMSGGQGTRQEAMREKLSSWTQVPLTPKHSHWG